jgi:hypothetical protein
MTPEVRTSLIRVIKLKQKLILSGGSSPFSPLFHKYQQEQRFALGIFGLRDTVENLRLLNQPLFDFSLENSFLSIEKCDPVVYDGTKKSVFRESGRRFLVSTHRTHLKSLDAQAERIFIRLYEKAKAIYGWEEGEEGLG